MGKTCSTCDFVVVQSDGYLLCHWHVQTIQIAMGDGRFPEDVVSEWEETIRRSVGFHENGDPKEGGIPCPVWRERPTPPPPKNG